MKKILLTLFVAIIACKKQDTNTEVIRWEKHASNIEIIRDDFGVPHIYGKTDADAVFGLLYAQCEDDFNRVEQNYIWATGRLAEVEGEEAMYSDLRARLFMTKEEAIANYEKAPVWLKKLCDAFADGINYYLYTHPEVTPKLITHFEPWMPMYFSEGSIGGDIERVSTKRIKAFYENKEALKLTAYGDALTHKDPHSEPSGSNGFAISGKRTQSGNAMLLINPHTSFFFRGEVHVVSEEGLNAYGAITWGQFFVYQGFNEKTGWMHTSTYTDVIDEYIETISSQDGQLKYAYGDESRDVTTSEVTLKYKDGDQIREREFPIYKTHHGPITHMIDDKWVSTALMWSPVKALEQSYTRTKLNGHKAFKQMMNIRTNSSNNTVYADADGNIAYYHGNFIPKRDTIFNFRKPVDGSNPATDWKGLHTVDESIVVVNPESGWIQNCNSTPFTSAAEYSPKKKDYPKYMSIDRENFRGIHAIRLLKKVDSLTLDKLIEIGYDPYLPAFETLIPGLIEAYDQSPVKNTDLKEPIDILRKWDFAVSSESVAMSLAHFYGLTYRKLGKKPENLSAMETFTYFGTSSPTQERLSIFSKTISQLNTDFGSWNTPWGEINRYQRINGDIQQPFDDSKPSLPVGLASGRWGALASYGAKSYDGTKRIYGNSGNSFVAVVEFGDKVKAKTMLAGGQSGDPDSPHFDDQAQRYIDVKFKDVAYYKEDVVKRAKKTYQPGEK
ncbi:acylase [Aquimarina sp. AD10]|uniref:acylase n=1 Tax=Aquimarina sp. AD10 TaxID=1714849 RepID=UPI000E553808|nr:acylase [Aquimarina sp. AD10]AXT63313.1 acylase [Aquimarina sp. AD10]RKN00674.1 acylase [Aquimarina sp. AD10]